MSFGYLPSVSSIRTLGGKPSVNFKITFSGGRRANTLAGKGLFPSLFRGSRAVPSTKNTGICATRLCSSWAGEVHPIITGSAPADGLWAADAQAARPRRAQPSSCPGHGASISISDFSVMALWPRGMPVRPLGKFLFSLLLLSSPKNIVIRLFI